MKFIKTFLASIAFIAVASSANAAVTDIGPLTESYDNIVLVPKNTTFDDFYTFELTAPAADFSIAKIVLSSFYNFSSLDFTVYSGVYGGAATELYTVSIPTSEEVAFSLNSLDVGSYYVQISGVTSGSSGGSYAFSITPVPEPSSVAMLLIGFAALGAVARRRKTL
ncbi:FxDxF family PEP-CTERM protein [Methylobacillus arboreus]|uniref:FxDxF family PEP-CTERM protein n=1 Tax=Methylobacillus arboreus TaxID=755170 RepID=UPI001E2D047B|nr:FxDxF family PEP-CTERM protein [Methylobacillus arboreus]MCB5190607.1 FxDxF family PEP-CTERM protein [Methylobacillus arboreus]